MRVKVSVLGVRRCCGSVFGREEGRKIIWCLIEKYSSEKTFKGPDLLSKGPDCVQKGDFQTFCACVSTNGPDLLRDGPDPWV